jgi:hypothetical protein
MPIIFQDIYGPDWPLGLISGPVIPIMGNVDPGLVNAPENSNRTGATLEFTPTCYGIVFEGFKVHPVTKLIVPNVGNVYVVRKGGSKADPGTIVLVVKSGETRQLNAPPVNNNSLNPYRYYIDIDVDGDGAIVTLKLG